MGESIRAAVKVAPSVTEIREFPMPEISPEAALLRVTAAGVCGHDVGTYPEALTDGPYIMGHENVGVIARIGSIAAQRWGLKEGDRIALEGFQGCGQCDSCRSGYVGFCPREGDPSAALFETSKLPSRSPSATAGNGRTRSAA